ncbi:unnamed protein product, partial [Phaeothamnion confervicola]
AEQFFIGKHAEALQVTSRSRLAVACLFACVSVWALVIFAVVSAADSLLLRRARPPHKDLPFVWSHTNVDYRRCAVVGRPLPFSYLSNILTESDFSGIVVFPKKTFLLSRA